MRCDPLEPLPEWALELLKVCGEAVDASPAEDIAGVVADTREIAGSSDDPREVDECCVVADVLEMLAAETDPTAYLSDVQRGYERARERAEAPNLDHVQLATLGELARLLSTVPRDELEMFAAGVEAVTRDLDRPAGRRPTAALTLAVLDAIARGDDAFDAMARLVSRDATSKESETND